MVISHQVDAVEKNESGLVQILRLNPFQQFEQVKQIWQCLQNKSRHSFFNSWGWVESWLLCLPKNSAIELIVILEKGEPLSCFFLGFKSGFKHRIVYKRRAYLNETGIIEYDDLTIEYNAPLEKSGSSQLSRLFSRSEFSGIEEFQFSGIPESLRHSLRIPVSWSIIQERKVPSYYIDLREIRHSGKMYIDYLSSNKRSQIRRSLKQYGDLENIQIKSASDKNEALAMLDALIVMHQKNWNRRGHAGAFSTEFFKKFHRCLISSRFEVGEIQLLKISNSSGSIGYLYNFIYDNQVLYYQSGLYYKPDNKFRPGIVCHFMAVEHNMNKNHNTYNFLGGEAQYKKSLSTNHDELYYITIGRKTMKQRVERFILKLRDQLKG